MNLLKKRPIAIMIMIVVILLSIVIGGSRSLLAERSRIIDYFYTDSDGDEYSIQHELEWIDAELNYLKTVALHHIKEDDPYLVRLNDARASLNAAKAIPEKYDAATELYSIVTALYEYLDPTAFDMNSTDMSFRSTSYENISFAMKRIAENKYNDYAREFNNMLESGISALIARTVRIDPIPIYG